MKIEGLKRDDGTRTMMFDCPGCGFLHQVHVAASNGPVWGWNGSMERPTFTPSVLVTWSQGEPPVTAENFEEYKRNPWSQTTVEKRCHSFVVDGRIQFLGDCTHALAGQTVDLPDIDL